MSTSKSRASRSFGYILCDGLSTGLWLPLALLLLGVRELSLSGLLLEFQLAISLQVGLDIRAYLLAYDRSDG